MSQPRPRRLEALAGCWGVDIFSIADCCEDLVAAQHIFCEFGKIVGCREEAGVAGDSAHAARGGIVDDAAQHFAILIVLRGRYARRPLCGRKKACVFHAERREDVLAGVLVERLAGYFLYDEAERLEVDVAIDEARAGRVFRL